MVGDSASMDMSILATQSSSVDCEFSVWALATWP